MSVDVFIVYGCSVKMASLNSSHVNHELHHLATQVAGFLDRLQRNGMLTKVWIL